jgi:hypothetical protein
MGTQRVQMKGVLPWLVHWSCRVGSKDFCSALAALVDPVQNIFFLTVHYFNDFDPIAQQSGQAAMLGRLSLSTVLVHMCSCSIRSNPKQGSGNETKSLLITHTSKALSWCENSQKQS